MQNLTFKKYLSSQLGIKEADLDPILSHCTTKNYQRGEFLLKPQEHCSHTFFVETGLLRMFSMDDKGKEHILQFAPEGWFVSDRESVYFNKPSEYYIEALEDCQVTLLNENVLKEIEKRAPSFRDLNVTLLHRHIHHLNRRINLLLSASAEDRYMNFIQMYPDLLLRIPQTMVASYLGITPESLSRVRKGLADKNFKR